jgi:DNA-binding transcriptional MocR family regulator
MALYHKIAHQISTHIDKGIYQPGSRLPGVRRLSQQFGVSVSTVVQAHRQLENNGLIEARPRSGYYVSARPWLKPELPAASRPELKPMPVTGQQLVLQLARLANEPDFVQLGAAVPDASFMPIRAFQRSLAKTVRHYGEHANSYAFPPGLAELQQQIARRMYLSGSQVEANTILITNGCQEALALALRTVAKPGDIIAIESPTFYGLLQVIESLGLKALEIPTDPREGLSIPALELALEQWPIKACVVIPNFGNPLGGLLSDHHKQQLVRLAKRHELILIEDDIYGDLGFAGERPRSLFSFSHSDNAHVIYCSSFSKTISQGLRIGWMILPRRYYEQAEYLKYVSNLASPTLPQLALAEFLEQGGYERYLHQVKTQYAQQISLFTHAISQYFPPGTRVTQPQGGFVLWVELNEDVDSLHLSHQMLTHKISIAPGQIFSATQKYRHCIRLNCAQPWSANIEKALLKIGSSCSHL